MYFQLKLSDTAVTLKYGQVIESGMNRESSMNGTIMQSLTFIALTVSEKILILKFSKSSDPWLNQKYTCILSPLNTH